MPHRRQVSFLLLEPSPLPSHATQQFRKQSSTTTEYRKALCIEGIRTLQQRPRNTHASANTHRASERSIQIDGCIEREREIQLCLCVWTHIDRLKQTIASQSLFSTIKSVKESSPPRPVSTTSKTAQSLKYTPPTSSSYSPHFRNEKWHAAHAFALKAG